MSYQLTQEDIEYLCEVSEFRDTFLTVMELQIEKWRLDLSIVLHNIQQTRPLTEAEVDLRNDLEVEDPLPRHQ